MTVGPSKRERTCIGCGEKAPKGQLHRIVRVPDGSVHFDPTGRAAGRGAYVCSKKCLGRASAKGALQRALRCKIGKDDAASIADEMALVLQGATAR